ncbi:MAG: helix-turn-helix transcriptional regulator [Cetobacterium sp.]|uniref:helix-turn-helix domain-containing protein n=1 Tax=Cetobacterium sp. TaxID=2071632 RepID=UPI002FC8426F
MEEKMLLKTKKILKEYMLQNNLTNAELATLTNVSEGTIKTYLSGKKAISLSFISNFSNLENIKKNDYIFLKELVKRNKKYPTSKEKRNRESEKVFKDDLNEIIILLKDSILDDIHRKNIKKNEYFENRKVGSFNSDIETRTLLIKKMWDFNDLIFERWSEVKFLINLNNKKDNIKLKKGLLSISETLKKISEELELATFDSDKIEKDCIIDLEEI